MGDNEQYERDKASARAYIKKQHKKLEESRTAWDSESKKDHYEQKIKDASREYRRTYNDVAPSSSGNGCTLS
jgi:hypothetical protein